MMDNPPPDQNALDNVTNLVTWGATSFMAAATIALRKATSIKVAAYHMFLATLIGPAGTLLFFWYNPGSPKWMGLIINVSIGLTIFVWAVWLEKLSKRAEDTDPALILRDKLDKVLPKGDVEKKS